MHPKPLIHVKFLKYYLFLLVILIKQTVKQKLTFIAVTWQAHRKHILNNYNNMNITSV